MKPESLYFIDIETVPGHSAFEFLEEAEKVLYLKKFQHEIAKTEVLPDGREVIVNLKDVSAHYKEKAALFAEFGRVVCVSMGLVDAKTKHIRVKTICSRDEVFILTELSKVLKTANYLCAHNGKEFDMPYLFRRYIINKIPIPAILNSVGKKPWEVPYVDTMEIWAAGQWKYKVSLNTLALIFGIPSPKTDMDGADVATVYYESKTELPFEDEPQRMERIANYCEKDLITLVKVYCRMLGYEGYNKIVSVK